MKKLILVLLILLVNLVFSSFEESKRSWKNFELLSTNGKIVSFNDYPNAKGFILVFTCNHCPFAKLYPERLNELNKKYAPLGVPLIAISSTDTIQYEEDTYSKMIEKAASEHFNFPYLFDGEQTVAKSIGAQKTPHAFVIWKEANDWKIKYNGAIDDNGAEPSKVTQSYVQQAVDELLKGKEVSTKEVKSIGCQIHFRKKNKQ